MPSVSTFTFRHLTASAPASARRAQGSQLTRFARSAARCALGLQVMFLSACDDHLLGLREAPAGTGWCTVQQLFAGQCAVCHSGAGAEAGLDLSSDPHAAVVDVPSTTDPSWTLVVPGDPDASFLYHKLSGELELGMGTLMPPTGPIDDPTLAEVRQWIVDGAPAECGDTGTTGTGTTGTGTGTGTGTSPPTELGWCGVQQVFAASCLACHSGDAPSGDLDLETDAHAALVGVPSATDPSILLVDPGLADASFLVLKLRGTLEADQGRLMPPTGALPEEQVDLVVQWVDDGASDECDETITVPPGYHPDGYADPAVHGYSAKFQQEECVDCHGADLTGEGDAPSCDTCHTQGWRTTCVYCHGGTLDETGAPPRHLSGVDDGLAASFVPHTAHVVDTARHVAWDCTTCHAKPIDVLTPGHIFVADETAGAAEVAFGQGLSPRATWNGTSCATAYCHGSGRGDDGQVDHRDAIADCHACHPDQTSGPAEWARMSGRHVDHLREGIRCEDCHAATTSGGTTIVAPELHVDGEVEVEFQVRTISRNGRGCTGICHGEEHDGEAW